MMKKMVDCFVCFHMEIDLKSFNVYKLLNSFL